MSFIKYQIECRKSLALSVSGSYEIAFGASLLQGIHLWPNPASMSLKQKQKSHNMYFRANPFLLRMQ